MAVSPLFRPVALGAGIFSVVQASVWSILSLLGILTSTNVIYTDLTLPVTLTNAFSRGLEYLYFEETSAVLMYRDSCAEGDLLSRTGVLVILSLYFSASVVWLAVSAVQLNDAYRFELKYTRNILYTWSAVTGVVILLDFATTVCFGRDYNSLVSNAQGCYELAIVAATLMALAARGFVLWIINVAFVVYLAKAAYMLVEDDISRYARKTSQESSISSLYQPPNMDSFPQESRSIVYQPSGLARTAAQATSYSYPDSSRGPASLVSPMYDGGIQSPQVGDAPRTPWSFPAPRHQPPSVPTTVRPPPAARYIPPPTQPPPLRHIPEPDYDEAPTPHRSKYEPRPFNEVPRRSALKKDHGRSYF